MRAAGQRFQSCRCVARCEEFPRVHG
jgi:hypothetical protein